MSIYIVCDMNCNNFGNYFKVIAYDKEVKEDKTSYRVGNAYYPKGHCYRGKIREPRDIDGEFTSFPYSQAVDELLPMEYVRWIKTRFNDYDKYKYRQAIEHARNTLGITWDDNRQRLAFYEYFDEYIQRDGDMK